MRSFQPSGVLQDCVVCLFECPSLAFVDEKDMIGKPAVLRILFKSVKEVDSVISVKEGHAYSALDQTEH